MHRYSLHQRPVSMMQNINYMLGSVTTSQAFRGLWRHCHIQWQCDAGSVVLKPPEAHVCLTIAQSMCPPAHHHKAHVVHAVSWPTWVRHWTACNCSCLGKGVQPCRSDMQLVYSREQVRICVSRAFAVMLSSINSHSNAITDVHVTPGKHHFITSTL